MIKKDFKIEIKNSRWTMLQHLMEQKRKVKSIMYKEYTIYGKIDDGYFTDLDKWRAKGKDHNVIIGAIENGIITVAYVEYENEE